MMITRLALRDDGGASVKLHFDGRGQGRAWARERFKGDLLHHDHHASGQAEKNIASSDLEAREGGEKPFRRAVAIDDQVKYVAGFGVAFQCRLPQVSAHPENGAAKSKNARLQSLQRLHYFGGFRHGA